MHYQIRILAFASMVALVACSQGSSGTLDSAMPQTRAPGSAHKNPLNELPSLRMLPAPWSPALGYQPVHGALLKTYRTTELIPLEQRHLERLLTHRHTDDTVSSPDSSGQSGYLIPATSDQYNGAMYSVQDYIDPSQLTVPAPPGSNAPGCNASIKTCVMSQINMSTTHGPGNNCMEVGEGYWNPYINAVDEQTEEQTHFTSGLFVYNFCASPAFYTLIPFDDNFQTYYVAEYSGNSDGLPQYVVQTQYESDGWHVLLYNAVNNEYEDYFVTGGYQGSNNYMNGEGWSLFETHFGPGVTCPTLPAVNTGGLRFYSSDTGWTELSTSNSTHEAPVTGSGSSNPDCFNPGSPPYYTVSFSEPNWIMTDPKPTAKPTTKPSASPTIKPCTNDVSSKRSTDVVCPQTAQTPQMSAIRATKRIQSDIKSPNREDSE